MDTRSTVSSYVQESLAPSTQLAYAADLRRFLDWGGTIPAPPQLLAQYLASHAGVLKVSTLMRHLASIVRAHSVRGLPSPSGSHVVRSTIKGIRRVHGSAAKQATPLTLRAVRKLVAPAPQFSSLRNARDRALLLMGYAGGFRRSELAALKTSDLTFSKRGVVVRLRSSKTDPRGTGREVALPYSQTSDCPVHALQAWLRISKSSPSEPLPLFRRIDRYDHLHDAALCGASVGWILQQRMRAIGMDPQGFSAHSLRSGFVTSAAEAGTPTWAIQRQTGHRTEQMVHRYIRGIGLFERNASASLFART